MTLPKLEISKFKPTVVTVAKRLDPGESVHVVDFHGADILAAVATFRAEVNNLGASWDLGMAYFCLEFFALIFWKSFPVTWQAVRPFRTQVRDLINSGSETVGLGEKV